MKPETQKIFDDFFQNYPALNPCRDEIAAAYAALCDCYGHDGKVLVCGNGGSAADAEHIVGELMKEFKLKRPLSADICGKIRAVNPEHGDSIASRLQGALPAISLVSQTSLLTAFINDVAADMMFAQQVYGYGRVNDLLIALSTSGNSANVVNAAIVARAVGMTVISFTGAGGGKLAMYSDVLIKVPERDTPVIQEYHLPIYHLLCILVERHFFG